MSDPILGRMSGPAFRFALMLRDFGHIDDTGLNLLLVTAVELAEPIDGEEAEVDLRTIRRAAARVLFDRGVPEIGEGAGILAEDWPLLFS
jgi:hypothetical protein